MKKAVFGIAAAAAILGVVMLLRGGTVDTSASKVPVSLKDDAKSAGRQPTELVLAISPGAPSTRSASPPAAKLSPLMLEYDSAKSAKPLHDRLSQAANRTPEENYVLAAILANCARVGDRLPPRSRIFGEDSRKQFESSVSAKDPNRAKRLAAFDRVASDRCKGFESVVTTPAMIRELLEKAAASGEAKARARLVEMDIWAPLLQPDGSIVRTRETVLRVSEAQLAAMREAAQSNDPYALMAVGRVLASTMGDVVIRVGPEERPIDPHAFHDAWALAACDAGHDCGPNHGALLQACMGNGYCDARDLREHLFFYGNSPQQSQLIAEYQQQITRAIRSGDWGYFAFTRASPTPGSFYMFTHP